MNSRKYKNIIQSYRDIQSSVEVVRKAECVTYDSPVNFNESMTQPRHRWFPYKEGFSPSFVKSFISEELGGAEVRLLDPFAGVGTAVMECAMMGGCGKGYDVNPLAHFIAKTKTLTLSKEQMAVFDAMLESLSKGRLPKPLSPPDNETVVSYFDDKYMEALLRAKAHVQSITDDKVHALFRLSLLSIVEQFSTHRKAGNGLKRKTRRAYDGMIGSAMDQVRTAMVAQLSIYRGDIMCQRKKIASKFVLGSSLELQDEKKGEKYDCVLTSPPYANCFDYSKIYMCELWLGDFFLSRDCQKRFREKSIRSHVHATWDERNAECGSEIVHGLIRPLLSEQKLWSKKIPGMLDGYFKDLGRFLLGAKKHLKKNAPLGFVVSNSVYGGIPIATDLLIVEVARKHGYLAERIDVYRNIVPSSQQYRRMTDKEYLRESMVLLRRSNEC